MVYLSFKIMSVMKLAVQATRMNLIGLYNCLGFCIWKLMVGEDSLNWSVFLEDVARTLNFTTEISLQFIKNGSDHHNMFFDHPLTHKQLHILCMDTVFPSSCHHHSPRQLSSSVF